MIHVITKTKKKIINIFMQRCQKKSIIEWRDTTSRDGACVSARVPSFMPAILSDSCSRLWRSCSSISFALQLNTSRRQSADVRAYVRSHTHEYTYCKYIWLYLLFNNMIGSQKTVHVHWFSTHSYPAPVRSHVCVVWENLIGDQINTSWSEHTDCKQPNNLLHFLKLYARNLLAASAPTPGPSEHCCVIMIQHFCDCIIDWFRGPWILSANQSRVFLISCQSSLLHHPWLWCRSSVGGWRSGGKMCLTDIIVIKT